MSQIENMTPKKDKSRNLSVYQFFQILQKEWIVADLRTRIYPKGKHKDYWTKVKEGKEATINQIAEKNHLPTIFTDQEMKRIFELQVYKEKGAPDFNYKSEENRTAQEPLDLTYYYSKGSEVRFDHFGEQKIGKVKSYTYGNTVALVQTTEDSLGDFNVVVSELTRIL